MEDRVLSDHGRAHRLLCNPRQHPEFIDDNGVKMSPDEALENGLCPETGVPLDPKTIEQHLQSLYPKPLGREATFDQARAMIDRIRAWAKDRIAAGTSAIPPRD